MNVRVLRLAQWYLSARRGNSTSSKMAVNVEEVTCTLSRIDVDEDANPFKLFQSWHEDAKKTLPFFMTNAMNLATVSKEGRVSNRTVLMQSMDEDGFIFNTDRRGRKSKEISEHPQVSASLYWCTSDNGRNLTRQARIEGIAVELDQSIVRKQYENASANHQIRGLLCHQGQEVEWESLKKRFDNLLEDVKSKKCVLSAPDSLIAYKIIPDTIEFYLAHNDNIADRVVFTKENNRWKYVHLEA